MADILDEPIGIKKQKPKNFLLTLLLFMLTGAWLFYWKPKLKRKWFYLFIFWYAWLALINVFVVLETDFGIKFLERFHNRNDYGAMTIFIGWGIYYTVGLIDWAALQHKEELAPKP